MKKRILVIVFAVLFCIGGVIAGLTLTNDSEAKEGSTDVNSVKVEQEQDTTKGTDESDKVTKEENKAEEKQDGTKSTESATASKNTSNSNTSKKSDTSNKSSTTNKNSSSTNKNSSSSNDKNSSTSNKDSSSSSKPSSGTTTKPTTHTHKWTAVYKEVDNGYYKTVTTEEYYHKCTACGADITGFAGDHHYNVHALKGENSSTTGAYRYVEKQVWVPKIEKVVSYYKCSCGATK